MGYLNTTPPGPKSERSGSAASYRLEICVLKVAVGDQGPYAP